MSSCFLCDCSYTFTQNDRHDIIVPSEIPGGTMVAQMKIKQLPIMIGSPGNYRFDQQHVFGSEHNYLSYIVKKIEFQCSFVIGTMMQGSAFPDYVLIFKVPLRDPIIDYNFRTLDKFILYSAPESVLGYKVIHSFIYLSRPGQHGMVKIDINKPFVVGPRDYIGVLYMNHFQMQRVDASAKVWFDTA